MATDYKFEGWLGEDAESVKGKMVWKEFEPKKWEENDVDIKITHSGICGSDLHTLRSGWVSYKSTRSCWGPLFEAALATCVAQLASTRPF